MLQTIADIMFWIVAALLAWNAYILIFNKGVPNIRTAPQTRDKMIEVLKAHAALKTDGKPYIIVDMGAGNGLLTRCLAQAMPDAQVIGIEISLKSFLWAEKMRRWLQIKNLKYLREDFFKYDIAKVDAIVFYLSTYEMGIMAKKLREEMNENAIAISNRFRLRGWDPAEVVEARTWSPFEREFYVYNISGETVYQAA